MSPVAPVRVRFAPSPTGYLHIGSARTALFNWLYARHLRSQGLEAEFVLRIEDTDHERSKTEYIELIFDALSWMGIDWDNDPTLQSTRQHLHDDAVVQLVSSGAAYRCDCTQDAAKARAEERGRPGYDGHCRDRDVSPEVTHVIRFRVPDEGETSFDDLIRGTVTFEHRNLEDFVLQRSDGTPVFIVANAVDDAEMGITHVIRGEDLLNVTPKVILVRAALGHTEPLVFAHMPLIVNEKRQKLSKRRDDVSMGDYMARGFLPEAMVNYLALLGWGPPDGVEVRPLSEIIELFDITDVNQSPAAFDVKKLESINGDYIRALDVDDFVARCRPHLAEVAWADRYDEAVFRGFAPLVQTRVKVLSDVAELIDFLFLEEPPTDEASWTKAMESSDAPGLLDAAIASYGEMAEGEWTAERLHEVTVQIAESAGLKLGKAQAPIRVATTGRTVGPPLFEALAILGRQVTLDRLAAARSRLAG